MPKISSIATASVPTLSDKLIGTSVGGTPVNQTNNFTLQQLKTLFDGGSPPSSPNLQSVLNAGNTATQSILLTGLIEATNLDISNDSNLKNLYLSDLFFDKNNSQGTNGQYLISTGTGVQWSTLTIGIPTLQQVLTAGNVSDKNIITTGNIQGNTITGTNLISNSNLRLVGTLSDFTNSVGTSGQVLSSTVTGTDWVDLPVYSAVSPLIYNNVLKQFSIQQATGTQNGYLSSADWITFDGKQNAGNYITALTGQATASGPGSATITLNNLAVINKTLSGLTVSGGTITAADSIVTAFGKLQNQINGIAAGLNFQGVWNAFTNTPTLISSVGANGDYYVVDVAGNTNLNGITDWKVGDWAIFNGSAWQKIDNTDSVVSVNGQIGIVVLDTDDVSEGGTNLYYTDTRSRNAISSLATGLTYTAGTGVFSLTAGYSIPTIANQTDWTTAYNNSITSAAVTGTTTKTLTLNQQDGGTITANWTEPDLTGFVPYTGANQAVVLGYNALNASILRIDGPSAPQGGYLGFKQSTNVIAGEGSYTSIYAFGSGYLGFKFPQSPTGYKDFTFDVSTITTDVPGGRIYSMPDADGTLALTSDIPTTSTVYQNEIHVSQIDGNDTTGTGTLLNPVATITKGLTLITGQRRTIIIHPGNYTENPSITAQYTVLSTYELIGGNTLISGTVSTNTGCTVSGLKMTNLNITAPTGQGNVNILNCDISGTLTKSSTGDYTLIRFCDIGATNITSSAGVVAIFGGNASFITVNNAGARLLVKNSVCISPVLLAGNATFADSIIVAVSGTANALTTSAGTIVTIGNSQFVVPSFNNVARVSLSGFYSIFNTIYDKPNSFLITLSATGGPTDSIDYFQFINADKFIKQGGTSNQFLKADGSVDSSAYIVLGSLSASAPLSYNNTTGAFSISQSGAASDGYLSSTDWTTFNSKIGSIGLSMPSAFSVANSPLTSNGTINVTGAGLASQYVRGDGTLANFPDNGGGGSSVNYYLNGSVNQGTFGGDTYYEMSKTPIFGAGTNFTRTNAQGSGYIASFITDAGDPALLNVPGGNWNLEIYFQASSGGGSPNFYGEIYKVSAANVFTLIGSGAGNPEGITNGTAIDQYFTSVPVAQTPLLATDRLAIRLYVNPNGRDITLHTEDNNLAEVLTTLSTGLNALNGLTTQVQYFAVGTSGADFGISSAVDTHTFNLPTASAVNRGALSSADWTTFNSKQNTLSLTTTGTSGAATLVGSTLNIPNYAPDLSGYVTLGTTQTLTGLKTILRGGDVLNFKIGTDTLYGLKIAYNQNELVPSGEATWSFESTFNNGIGTGLTTTPISFFRGVLVTGQRLLSSSVNSNLLSYYGNNPSGRYPIYAYNTGVQQFASSIIVGETTGVVNAVTGAIADLPSGVVANFKGRVIGSNAVNSNEFATLGQIPAPTTSIMIAGGGTCSTLRCGVVNTASGAYSGALTGQYNTASGGRSIVAGGYFNSAIGNCSTVSGGYLNAATGAYSFAGGGQCNTASGYKSFVGGGANNTAQTLYSTVSGGYSNSVSGCFSFVGGGQSNTISFGQVNVAIAGGASNSASASCAFIGGGYQNCASGIASSVLGGNNNIASGSNSTISGGCASTASGCLSFVGGGFCNRACGTGSVVVGGGAAPFSGNVASGNYSFLGGGKANTASGYNSFVGGGECNIACACNSSVVGGSCNRALDGAQVNCFASGFLCADSGSPFGANGYVCLSSYDFYNCFQAGNQYYFCYCDYPSVGTCGTFPLIATSSTSSNPNCFTFCNAYTGYTGDYSIPICIPSGGAINQSVYSGSNGFVGGGCGNIVGGVCSFIGAGCCNSITSGGSGSGIVSGTFNQINGNTSFIGGGYGNKANGNNSTVVGGNGNTASSSYSFVGNGISNTACAPYSFVGGGYLNTASGCRSFVGGGQQNTASNSFSSVVGGYLNTASGYRSFVGGGFCNTALTLYSTISGGYCNANCGCFSFIGGGSSNVIGYGQVNSAILGGTSNSVGYSSSFIVGSNITANRACTTFVNDLSICSFNSCSGCSVCIGTNGLLTAASGGGGSIMIAGSGTCSTMRCGVSNNASGTRSFAGGGGSNSATASYSVVVGGLANTASGAYAFVGNGFNNTASSCYSFIGGGCSNIASGSFSIVGGGYVNRVNGNFSTISGGYANCICASAPCSVIGGGRSNIAIGCTSTVSGGRCNTASGYASFIGGGYFNSTNCLNPFPSGGNVGGVVAGGACNAATGAGSFIGGGQAVSPFAGFIINNVASGRSSTISGGYKNTASSFYSFIGGGGKNTASAVSSTVSGGYGNTASGYHSFVGGGYCNTSSGSCSIIGGGNSNISSAWYSTVSGGYFNTASADYTSVLGGKSNKACFVGSTVVGGANNTASGSYSVTGGGSNQSSGSTSVTFGSYNIASGDGAVVVGGGGFGSGNTAVGAKSFIGGGVSNRICVAGCCSAILGGASNTVNHFKSFIIGSNLTSSANCTTYVNALSKTSGTFRINHPDPAKTETHYLQHSFVESPTRGDNIYRYKITTSNCHATLALPDYYKFLNEDDQVFVTPNGHFGSAYGVIDSCQNSVNFVSNADGEYNVLIIGTRKDIDAKNGFNGVEILKKL